jgi:hypothetical protein
MFRNKFSFYGEDLLAPRPRFSPSTSAFHPRRLPALLSVPVYQKHGGVKPGTLANRGAIDTKYRHFACKGLRLNLN